MSFSFNPKNSKKHRVISDINITPFVDVLLVLLIIFMVTASMITSSIDVNLPKGAASPTAEKVEPITISVKSDGTIFLQDQPIKLGSMATELLKFANNNLGSKIYVRADKNLDYGRVMEVVKSISFAGFNQVVLVTELAP